MTFLQSKGHTANRWTISYFVCREKSENKNKRRQRNLTNAAPNDVFSTTGTAVVNDPTTDGTIAPSIYEVEKLKAIVELLVRFEKEEKGQQ